MFAHMDIYEYYLTLTSTHVTQMRSIGLDFLSQASLERTQENLQRHSAANVETFTVCPHSTHGQ